MQALGIMAFLIVGGLAGNSLLSILAQPHVQSAIEGSVPFIAGHATALTYIAVGALALIVVAFPPLILNRERENAVIDGAFVKIGIGAAISMGIASVGYLLGIGWIAATAIL
jgi:hypothetical protein